MWLPQGSTWLSSLITGKICGDVLPSPLLIESDQAIVIFVSDGSIHGRGFEFTFSAVHPASEAGNFTFASGPLCGGQLGKRQLLALYLFSKKQVVILPPFAYFKYIEVEKELNVDLPVNKVQMVHNIFAYLLLPLLL